CLGHRRHFHAAACRRRPVLLKGKRAAGRRRYKNPVAMRYHDLRLHQRSFTRRRHMDASETRTHFPPPGGYGKLPFSMGVLVGSTFYLSGHLGLDLTTRKVPADVDQEARLMMDGFRATLEKA